MCLLFWVPEGFQYVALDIMWIATRLQNWEKAMGSCTAQCKILLFCAKTVKIDSRNIELACLKKDVENRFWPLGDFHGSILLWCFISPLGVLLVTKILEDEACKLPYLRFWEIFVLSCILCHTTLHIESADSMIVLIMKMHSVHYV